MGGKISLLGPQGIGKFVIAPHLDIPEAQKDQPSGGDQQEQRDQEKRETAKVSMRRGQ